MNKTFCDNKFNNILKCKDHKNIIRKEMWRKRKKNDVKIKSDNLVFYIFRIWLEFCDKMSQTISEVKTTIYIEYYLNKKIYDSQNHIIMNLNYGGLTSFNTRSRWYFIVRPVEPSLLMSGIKANSTLRAVLMNMINGIRPGHTVSVT